VEGMGHFCGTQGPTRDSCNRVGGWIFDPTLRLWKFWNCPAQTEARLSAAPLAAFDSCTKPAVCFYYIPGRPGYSASDPSLAEAGCLTRWLCRDLKERRKSRTRRRQSTCAWKTSLESSSRFRKRISGAIRAMAPDFFLEARGHALCGSAFCPSASFLAQMKPKADINIGVARKARCVFGDGGHFRTRPRRLSGNLRRRDLRNGRGNCPEAAGLFLKRWESLFSPDLERGSLFFLPNLSR